MEPEVQRQEGHPEDGNLRWGPGVGGDAALSRGHWDETQGGGQLLGSWKRVPGEPGTVPQGEKTLKTIFLLF